MSIYEATRRAVQTGKAIVRQSWGGTMYILPQAGAKPCKLVFTGRTFVAMSDQWTPSGEDLTATDWGVATPPKVEQ